MTTFTTYIVGWMRTYVRRDDGATMVEYALMVAAVAMVAFGAAFILGGGVANLFTNTNANLP